MPSLFHLPYCFFRYDSTSLRANIHALAAEDTIEAPHAAGLDRGVDVDAHRAPAVALFAVDAATRRGLDPHLRQVQEPAPPSAPR